MREAVLNKQDKNEIIKEYFETLKVNGVLTKITNEGFYYLNNSGTTVYVSFMFRK